MVYLITYDLKKPKQNYSKLYDAIKSFGNWWHYLDSTWLVDTALNAEQIHQVLKQHVLDQNDYVLITRITPDTTASLPDEANRWITSRIGKTLYHN